MDSDSLAVSSSAQFALSPRLADFVVSFSSIILRRFLLSVSASSARQRCAYTDGISRRQNDYLFIHDAAGTQRHVKRD